ncbi:MAG: L-lactate permease [bacterium]
MISYWLLFLAFLPLLLVPVLFYWAQWPKAQTMPLACLSAAVIAFIFWGVEFAQVTASVVYGLLRSAEIIVYIFCALFFFQVVRLSGIHTVIRETFSRIHPDRRVQAILIAWFFGSFLESVMGFSATGAVCSLLLMGIGFPPACAAMLGLMGPMTASSFCALGMPITYGVANGLQQPSFWGQLTAAGMDMDGYLRLVTAQAAILHGIVGTFMPLGMVMFVTRYFGRNQSWREGLEVAPFALFAGLAFTVPYVLTAVFFGPEFPSLAGSLIGAALTFFVAETGVLTPSKKWDFPPENEWGLDWVVRKYHKIQPRGSMLPLMAWLPFLLLAVFMAVSRFPELPLAGFLKSYTLEWPSLLGTEIGIRMQPLFVPSSLCLLAVSVIGFFYLRLNVESLQHMARATMIPLWEAVLNILFVMPLMALYTYSDVNAYNNPSMLQVVASWIGSLWGSQLWGPFFMPFFSALGSFLVGNNTLCNLAFAWLQHNLSGGFDVPCTMLMALQVVGASIGNMLATHYLVGSCVAVGMLGWGGPIGRKALRLALWYALAVSVVGMILVYFNVGEFVQRMIR